MATNQSILHIETLIESPKQQGSGARVGEYTVVLERVWSVRPLPQTLPYACLPFGCF